MLQCCFKQLSGLFKQWRLVHGFNSVWTQFQNALRTIFGLRRKSSSVCLFCKYMKLLLIAKLKWVARKHQLVGKFYSFVFRCCMFLSVLCVSVYRPSLVYGRCITNVVVSCIVGCVKFMCWRAFKHQSISQSTNNLVIFLDYLFMTIMFIFLAVLRKFWRQFFVQLWWNLCF